MDGPLRPQPWWRRPGVVLVAAYLAGAIPFSNLMAKRRRGVDLRSVGSGTVSGTSLYHVAGFGALALSGICDIAKGAVGPALAGPDRPELQAAACAAAVAGHNWSPFLGGAGGRGISPAIGALGAAAPAGSAVLLGGMTIGRLGGETAIGSLAADAVVVPLLARINGRRGALAGAGVVAAMLAKRLAGNAPVPSGHRARTYLNRLVFDRDTTRKQTDGADVADGAESGGAA
ncbi:MAG: glycerol-3-phosphate acyltransferase [Acidimicrobiia bacterium]|nr:glycerol-3-phosphate acyltransferase [Acidimicrobiia bacterium]